MRVRRATKKDAGCCAEIHLSARAAMAYLPQDLHSAEETRAWVYEVVFSQEEVWVAEFGSRIVGYASLEGEVLNNLYVRPQFQRRGFGSALMSEIKKQSPKGLKLHTFEPNVDAIRFYERHGFMTVDRTDGHANEEKVADRLMAWRPEA